MSTTMNEADNSDAKEVCRLLSTLDWIVGYELVGENQTVLDRAQELSLKVMGMSDPPHMTNNDKYIVPIEVLCVTCKQPIKGWVNSPQWLRVEWISPQGECRACDQQAKEGDDGN